ncbi:MAG TPA: hypothetical protein VJ808_11170, partial [Gemmatimonadales bacterium]|nr:hypothetical protein [Gemmatimonadales bacterium]
MRGREGAKTRGREGATTQRRKGAVIIALVLGAACKGASGDDAAAADSTAADTTQAAGAPLALPVVGQEVRRGDLVLSVVTTGQIRSEAMSLLKSETQGTIIAVLVRPGD